MAQILEFQLELFETPEKRLQRMRMEAVEARTAETKASLDRVRKKTFATINELRKHIVDVEQRLEYIESAICRGCDE